MAGLRIPICSAVSGCHNLKLINQSCFIPSHGCQGQLGQLKSYSTDVKTSKQPSYEEKKKKFQELETKYHKMLRFDSLTPEERRIHFLHADAVARGHFTYDDPFLEEKVLTRLRHFLKGKCCGKSCRHCIYEHTAVVDEKQKARARFNSSYWVYDKEEEETAELDDHHVITYGRGPYPRKYAQNAPENMIKIPVKPRTM